MITKEAFFKYLIKYQEFEKGIDRMSKAITGDRYSYSIWESDWAEAVGCMLDTFLNSYFTEEGIDWINYYLFEDIEDKLVVIKKPADMFNEESEIEYHLNSIEELWNFLQTDINLYFNK